MINYIINKFNKKKYKKRKGKVKIQAIQENCICNTCNKGTGTRIYKFLQIGFLRKRSSIQKWYRTRDIKRKFIGEEIPVVNKKKVQILLMWNVGFWEWSRKNSWDVFPCKKGGFIQAWGQDPWAERAALGLWRVAA